MSVEVVNTSTGSVVGTMVLDGSVLTATGRARGMVAGKRNTGMTDSDIYEYFRQGWSNGYAASRESAT